MDGHAPARFRIPRRELMKVVAAGIVLGAAGRLPGVAAVARADGVPDLVAGNTAFALDLYAALRQNEDLVPADGNLLFSPYSVSQALAMTYAGAGGQTATQMADVLAFGLSQPALHEAFADLNTDLVARGNAGADSEPVYAGGVLVKQARGLRIANGVWGEQTFPFSPAYSAQLAESYGAGLQETDFKNAPDTARQEINAWVAAQTEDRVRDIVPPGAIDSLTRLVLANAIWFSGGWEKWFSPDATEDGDFFLRDGGAATVPFMVQRDHLDYARGDGYQVVELPYAGSGFAFTVVLPDVGRFEAVEAGLDADALNAAIGQLDYTEVLVYLPKFAFEFGAISLKPALQALGMADAFDRLGADFTGMVDGTPPEPLYIDDVLHKAFISVDEEGTEAAAATVVEMAPGASPPEEEPPEVRVDRPFLFTIRDTMTGTLLFLGRVLDPST
jgi:serpin B